MKINIRESLGKLDLLTDNKYDLRNHYDASKVSNLTKNRLAEALNEKASAEKINRILNENFAINVFPRDSEEYEKLEKVADYLTNYSPNNIYYRVEKTYFDYGQDWQWTTIIAYRSKSDSWQAINPRQQESILLCTTDEELEEVAKDILRKSRLDKGFNESLNEASYGGAYDIEDDMYFTKEEIVDLAYEVCNLLKKKFGYDYDIEDVYMNSHAELYMLIIDVHNIEAECTTIIDMRKIRKPSDLYKYSKTIADRMSEYFEEAYQEYEFDESLTEDVFKPDFVVGFYAGPTDEETLEITSPKKLMDVGVSASELKKEYSNVEKLLGDYTSQTANKLKDENHQSYLKSLILSFAERKARESGKLDKAFRDEQRKFSDADVSMDIKIEEVNYPFEDGIRKLSKRLGKMLLPKRENLNEAYRPLAIGYMILKKEIPNHVNYAEFANYDEVVTAIPSEADVVVYPRGGKISSTDIAYWQFDAIDSEGKKTKANFSTYIYSLKDFLNNDEMEFKLIPDFKLIDEYPYLIEVDDDIEESLTEGIEDLDSISSTKAKDMSDADFKILKPLIDEYLKDRKALGNWPDSVDERNFVKKWYKLADKCKEIAKNGIKGITGYGRLNDFIKIKILELARSVDNTFLWYVRNQLEKFGELSESLYEKLNNREKNVFIDKIEKAKSLYEIEDTIKDIRIYDLKLYSKLVHYPNDFEKAKNYILKILKNSMLKEDYDDEVDLDYETDFDDDGVEEGTNFIEDGTEWVWVERVAGPIHLDFDNWAVWAAREYVDPRDFITMHDDGKGYDFDGDGFKKKAMAAPINYFVVDEDTGFIDWGPVETQTEAQDFLNGKVEDWEKDESLQESKELKEWHTHTLHYEDIGDGKEYDYEVDHEDLLDYILEIAIDEDDAPEDAEEYMGWVEDNFDELFKKYEYNILNHFEEDASQEEYDKRYEPYE